MKTIAAAQFKAQCLTLMDDVQSTREHIVITKRGKPVAKLIPAEKPKKEFIGRLKGVFQVIGDIESPSGDWETSL
jgi:prevent-host-death family protein